MHQPSKIAKIIGDGNCFFRCVSLGLTGVESYHQIVRDRIVAYMMTDRISQQLQNFGAETHFGMMATWHMGYGDRNFMHCGFSGHRH